MTQRILVVEDNSTCRVLIEEFLEYAGYAVLGLQDGARFFRSIAEFQPDLILLDLKLPIVDGWTLLEQWQQSEWCSIPIVVLSTGSFQRDKQKALQSGARSYLVKPEHLDVLLQVVKTELSSSVLECSCTNSRDLN